MNKVWSLTVLLAVLAFTSVGIMYLFDSVASYSPDRRLLAIDAVRAWCSSTVVIRQSGLPAIDVVQKLRDRSALRSLPILMAPSSALERADISGVPDTGIECVLVVTDLVDPYVAIRRVWVGSTRTVDALAYRSSGDYGLVFQGPVSVEGGSVFGR